MLFQLEPWHTYIITRTVVPSDDLVSVSVSARVDDLVSVCKLMLIIDPNRLQARLGLGLDCKLVSVSSPIASSSLDHLVSDCKLVSVSVC